MRRNDVDPSCIMYERPELKPLYEGLSYLTGLTVPEVADMAFRIIQGELDPERDLDGPPYRFWGGVDLSDVPEPRANCNNQEAWKVAQRHARRVKELLENNPTLATLLLVQWNIASWLRYWSVRFPDPDFREKFARELALAEEDIARGQERMLLKMRVRQ